MTVQDTIRGFDISNHTGAVTVSQMQSAAQQGYEFVFIMASLGVEFDPVTRSFDEQWPVAQQAGLIRGAYHFNEPDDPPIDQAKNFVNTVQAKGGLLSGDLPPVWDVDTPADGNDVLQALEYVENALKRRPIVYANPSVASECLGNPAFARYPLWIADYGVCEPSVGGAWTTWTFWQSAENQTLEGMDVDLDYFAGDLDALKAFIAASRS